MLDIELAKPGLVELARELHVRHVMTARTAKCLTPSEREARVQAMVDRGEITAREAALIDYREPTPQERAYAETLAPRAREALARRKAAV